MRLLWLLTCVLTFFSAAGMFESDALRTLGLKKGATQEEIKKAYKRLARLLAHRQRLVHMFPFQGELVGSKMVEDLDTFFKRAMAIDSDDQSDRAVE